MVIVIKFRTDMAKLKTMPKHIYYKDNKNIEVSENHYNNYSYRFIRFKRINDKLKMIFKNEFSLFWNDDYRNPLVIGLGNENNTADSIGPKTLKHIHVNILFDEIDENLNETKISALEPGVLSMTGIDTKDIIESIVKKIKADVVILIDSLVSEKLEDLGHLIQITDEGIRPGSGLMAKNSLINCHSLGVPVIVIGVPTALEYKKNETFLLSKSNIDSFVVDISKLIGDAIDEVLHRY